MADNPSILQKRVDFDFPRDTVHVQSAVKTAGLEVEYVWEGNIVFRYDTPEKVLEHLLKSGAGTAFYEAVDPARRNEMEKQFIKKLTERNKKETGYNVIHDYISCIARKRCEKDA